MLLEHDTVEHHIRGIGNLACKLRSGSLGTHFLEVLGHYTIK